MYKYNIKNSIIYLSTILFFCTSCASLSMNRNRIEIENPSTINLINYPVKIPISALRTNQVKGMYPLLLSGKGDTVAVQVNDLTGDGVAEELFFLIEMQPQAKQYFQLKWVNKPINYAQRTNVRHGVRKNINDTIQPATKGVFLANEIPAVTGFQAFQTDGPSWENDMVGFRHYLDGRNSKDLFGKINATLSPPNVGVNSLGVTEDNYHVMADWGRDILSVGNSVGIGGISMLIEGDKLARMGVVGGQKLSPIDSTVFYVRSRGPIEAIMDFNYHNWRIDPDRIYSVTEKVEIWPGIHGFKNNVSVHGLKGDELLVIGLVNSRTDKPLKQLDVNDDFVVLYTHDKQTYNKEWYLGLALIIPKYAFAGSVEAPKKGPVSTTFLAKINVKEGEVIPYYTIACWELRDPKFQSEAYFENYLMLLAQQLAVQVKIDIK